MVPYVAKKAIILLMFPDKKTILLILPFVKFTTKNFVHTIKQQTEQKSVAFYGLCPIDARGVFQGEKKSKTQ